MFGDYERNQHIFFAARLTAGLLYHKKGLSFSLQLARKSRIDCSRFFDSGVALRVIHFSLMIEKSALPD